MTATAFAQANQLFKEGKVEEAIALYKKATTENNRFYCSHHNLGEALLEAGRIDEAAAAFRGALAINPNSAWSLHKLGEMLNKLGQYEEAVGYLRQAVAKIANVPEFYLSLGTALVKLGQWSEAEECLYKVVQFSPNSLPLDREAKQVHGTSVMTFYVSEAYFYLGEIKSGQQQWSQAVEFYRQSWETNYGKLECCMGWAASLGKLGRWLEVVELYGENAHLFDESGELLFGFGQALGQLGRWEEAVGEYRKAINLGFAGAEVRHHLGYALGQLGKWDEAVVEYRLVVEVNPKSAQVRHQLGYGLMRLERWREAEVELRRSVELYPGSAVVWQQLGDVFRELGEDEEAIALSEETHALLISDKTVGNVSKAEYFSYLGQQKAKKKQWHQAIDFYRQAVELNSNSAELHHHLAYGLGQIEQWDEAIASYQKAIDLKPESAVLYHHLGNVLAKLNRWGEAITQYCKALDLKPESKEIKQSLTETLVKRNLLDIDSKNNLQGQFFNGLDIYDLWRQANESREVDLQQMRLTLELFPYRPLISIIMPVYNTPEKILREAIDSVLKQVYPYWELCIADDASTNQNVKSVLEEYIAKDPRIKVVFRTVNGHISAASNSALELATGEFIALLDHDDLLTPNALYEVALLLNRYPEADMIYSDEDKIDENNKLKNPFFKPQWCPDSFLSRMYTCHLGVYRRKLVEEIGNFRIAYEGSQDYDLVLRFTEKTNKIFHIPKILYHWRIHSESVTSGAEAKPYAYEAAKKALTEALQRRGEPGKVIDVSGLLGAYTIRYDIFDYKLVSIIIPTRDLSQILDTCLTSIFTKSVYPNYEVIVIDNGSVEKETVRVISKWKNKEPQRFKSYVFDIPFNYSKINNYGVTKAEGDYLLFLNNDTEIITPDWMDAMVEQAQRNSIGAVGSLLLYPDNTIQHAGVVMGLGGLAAHSHHHFDSTTMGYGGHVKSITNVSAVTGACLMCRREVFDSCGGFDEELAVAYNDVDLCLKMLERGYQNIYLPHVVLYHHESKSRGYEDTPEKKRRQSKEADVIRQRWQKYIDDDPCYSPNLTRHRPDYSLNVIVPMIEIRNVSVFKIEPEILWGVHIDSPKSKTRVEATSVQIKGWVVGKKSPAVAVELLYNEQVLRKVVVDSPRPDVGEVYSDVLWAKTSGFKMNVGVMNFLPGTKLFLQTVLGDGSFVPLANIELGNQVLV